MITALRNAHISTKFLFILMLLNVIDFQTTKILVDIFGYHVERNPVMLWAMTTMDSVYAILIAKIVILGFYTYWHFRLPVSGGTVNKNTIKYVLFLFLILFGTVCILNTNMVIQTLGVVQL